MKNLNLIFRVSVLILLVASITSCQQEEIIDVEEINEELVIEGKTNSTTTKAATTQVVRNRFRSSTSLRHQLGFSIQVSDPVQEILAEEVEEVLYWEDRPKLDSFKNYCKIKWQEYRANGQAFCNSIWGNNSAQKAACRLYYTEIAENEIRTTCRR